MITVNNSENDPAGSTKEIGSLSKSKGLLPGSRCTSPQTFRL